MFWSSASAPRAVDVAVVESTSCWLQEVKSLPLKTDDGEVPKRVFIREASFVLLGLLLASSAPSTNTSERVVTCKH